MSKRWKPGKKTVELRGDAARPSRIRRDPLPSNPPKTLAKDAWWASREWEVRLSVAGIIFFALSICAAVIDIGELLSR